jgi:hypothetical protein
MPTARPVDAVRLARSYSGRAMPGRGNDSHSPKPRDQIFIEAHLGTQRNFAMPRYFIDLRDGEDLDRDPDGFEAPDLHGAGREARRVMSELRQDWTGAVDVSRMAIEVADEAGQVLLTVGFAARIDLH